MKRIFLFLFLSVSLFAQSKFDYFNLTWQKETIDHIQRVEADGGIVPDKGLLNQEILKAKIDDSYSNHALYISALFGVKKDANNKVTKLYDLFGHDLVQSDTSKAPTFILNGQNGKPVLRFDGVNDVIKTEAFTLNQPELIYFAGKQRTHTNNDVLFDGFNSLTMAVRQETPSPDIVGIGGLSLINSTATVGSFQLIQIKYNTSSSYITVNDLTPKTGNLGVNNAGGFTLGARGAADNYYSAIDVGSVRILSIMPTTAQNSQIKSSTYSIWGIQ